MRHWSIGMFAAVTMVAWTACGGGYGLQPPDAVCGNGEIEAGELCDASDLGDASCASLNLGSGELACGENCGYDVSGCTEQAVCGNGTWEYPEDCDGASLNGMTCQTLGFAGGVLGCSAGCRFDTTRCEGGGECGNGTREPGEDCDGNDVGGANCASLNLGEGSVRCTAQCAFDVSQCSVAAECDNGTVEYPEVCDGAELGNRTCGDEGFYDGLLGCAADCLSFDTSGCFGECGDAEINGPESCDGSRLDGESCRSLGYYGGDLACTAGCLDFDVTGCDGTCGDGVLNGPESCDTNDFGADSCVARGFYAGNLACNATCDRIDPAGCTGSCGDGVINGTEVCDGVEVGGDTCANHSLEGTLRCLSDCSGINLASCIATDLLITEVGLSSPDFVEITNTGSAPIDLDGWTLEWFAVDGGQQETGTLVLPAYVLQPGARVTIEDTYGANPNDPPTVDTGNALITFYSNIQWTDQPGSVTLWDPNDAPVDFLRWTDDTFGPPTGLTWADTPDYIPANDWYWASLSRVPDLTDSDTAAEWCITGATPGAANEACRVNTTPVGTVLINEVIDAGQTDSIELYNPTNTPVELGGWTIYAISGQGTIETLPAFTLAGGAYVMVTDDAGRAENYVDSTTGIHVGNLNIATDDTAIRLLEPELWQGVDFVRYGGSGWGPTAPDTWADTPAALGNITFTGTPVSLGRSAANDTNVAGDWCLMSPSPAAANNACN